MSHKSARKAEKLSYKNVKVFADGFPAWKKDPSTYTAIEVSSLKSKVDSDSDMVIVDSRPKKAKYDKGHIPGAINIPDRKFDVFKGTLPEDKSKLVVFYCGGYT